MLVLNMQKWVSSKCGNYNHASVQVPAVSTVLFTDLYNLLVYRYDTVFHILYNTLHNLNVSCIHNGDVIRA